ncbi:MAG: MFS transporter [Eubacteriales bacterium]|nr:MFS transporter [Eubacteriales bacterium]
MSANDSNEKLTRTEISWILYDVGNSAFTMLACSLIPIWFKTLAIGNGPGQVSSDKATAYWALITSVVTIVTALLGPILGTLMDYEGRKKIFFVSTVAIGAVGCLLTGFSSNWVIFMAIYAATRISYAISLIVYDAMLGDVAKEEHLDAVSTYGYGWGYIGSCVPFLIALAAYILGPDMLGKISNRASMIIGFGVTAIWWFGVSLPLMKRYKQIHFVPKEKHGVMHTLSKLGNTVKTIVKDDKKVMWFLIAFFLYIDGVDTIIDNCINVGTDLGLNTVGQVVTLVVTQVVAFAFSLLFVKLTKKYTATFLLKICILGYFVVCLYALTLHDLVGFAILAMGVGMFQGSIQSLSRSYFTKIIPKSKSGEYFGIYDIFSKGASFLGSGVLAAVKLLGYSANIAVASLAVFFILGFFLMRVADRIPARNSEEA